MPVSKPVIPLGKNVLLRLTPNRSEGGLIIIPASVARQRQEGVVVALPPVHKCKVVVDQKVLVPPTSGLIFKLNGVPHLIIEDDKILCAVE